MSLLQLHNRMPAILSDPESIATWLDTSDGQWSPKLANLLKPFDGELEMLVLPTSRAFCTFRAV
jgi:putative SOS response-associated peptidase YedK